MGKKLEGKTALITGSGKKTGIGYGIAKELAACGAIVIITDLGDIKSTDSPIPTGTTAEMDEIAESLSQEYQVETMAVSADVTDKDLLARMVEQVQKRFPTVDILCNNAGASFGVPNAVHTYDEDAWFKMFDVNLHSVFRVTRAVLPMMENGGSVINTASRAGKVPPLFNGAYAVAKAGVIMLTKVMARELAPSGVRVNAICPGQISTDLEEWRFGLEAEFYQTTKEERIAEMCKTIPLNRIGNIQEVGQLVAFLASEESSYITGQAINVTGGQLMEL